MQRNKSFVDWMRETYSRKELERLTTEATDCDMYAAFDPFGPYSSDQQLERVRTMRDTVKRLYRRYAADVWLICWGAASERPGNAASNVLEMLGRLEMANQIRTAESFEEFTVRNAMKYAARHLIDQEKT